MDKNKKLNECINLYKAQLEKGDIQIAYEALVKYTMALKAHLSKEFKEIYSFGNISPGYLDFTYFPFFNSFLRSRKLRFGIVLNHQKIRFELWLMGQNAEVQTDYWKLLKETRWNSSRTTMPKYSVLEAVIWEEPDFNDLDALTREISNHAVSIAGEIQESIRNIEALSEKNKDL